MVFKKRASLIIVLLCLTLLSILAQITFYLIHSHTTVLLDTLVKSSLPANFFHGVVLQPLILFISIQILAYVLFIGFLWFIATACSEFFGCSDYAWGIFFWVIGTIALFSLNDHFFPATFFASRYPYKQYSELFLVSSCFFLFLGLGVAYYQFFRYRRQRRVGSLFIGLALIMLLAAAGEYFDSKPRYQPTLVDGKPNIILIGLDSVRPDFTGYFSKGAAHTPTIDAFLKTGLSFTEAYTPLARTYPAWVSILTGKHPKHSHGRINLAYPQPVLQQMTLAKELQQAGYTTIYATDEKRFSNITRDYGFDQVVGPEMGLNDFLLGGLSDFPLTNLLINLPGGHFLFPFNYANRAAAITYEPNNFLQLIKRSLHQRPDKPLFLVVHFCLTHWPFTWADDQQAEDFTLDQRYRSAVEKLDSQLALLMTVLQENGLLEHSLVVLLSDHGTTLGLLGDRLVAEKNYQGDPRRLKWLTVNKLNTAPHFSMDMQHDYSLNTSYGQGTDILSLKQYQVLLSFKGYGVAIQPGLSTFRGSLLDLAPTLLAFLGLPPLQAVDGVSLASLWRKPEKMLQSRPLFLETGYSVADIESNEIAVEKVIKHTIKLYQLDPRNGYLFVKPTEVKAVVASKQRAVLRGDWLLARYPTSYRHAVHLAHSKRYRLAAYYVLANLKTGKWTIGFDAPLAKQAPLAALRREFNDFYGNEL
jgi:arylsulfatase A-like enzyme